MEPMIVEGGSLEQANSVDGRFDPLLALIGTGEDLWKDQSADEYVMELRSVWTGA